jgi:hypothetical protein
LRPTEPWASPIESSDSIEASAIHCHSSELNRARCWDFLAGNDREINFLKCDGGQVD